MEWNRKDAGARISAVPKREGFLLKFAHLGGAGGDCFLASWLREQELGESLAMFDLSGQKPFPMHARTRGACVGKGLQ